MQSHFSHHNQWQLNDEDANVGCAPACPNDCSNEGECVAPGVCECNDPLAQNADCSTNLPADDENNKQGNDDASPSGVQQGNGNGFINVADPNKNANGSNDGSQSGYFATTV